APDAARLLRQLVELHLEGPSLSRQPRRGERACRRSRVSALPRRLSRAPEAAASADDGASGGAERAQGRALGADASARVDGQGSALSARATSKDFCAGAVRVGAIS